MTHAPHRNMRWWIPALIVLAVIAWIFQVAITEVYYRSYVFVFAPILGLLAIGFWLVLFTGFPGKKKLKLLGLYLGGLAVLVALFRICFVFDDFAGTSLPTFKPRWANENGNGLEASYGHANEGLASEIGAAPFLGANRDGIVSGFDINPDWENHPPQEIWRIPMGAGWAAFAVDGDLAVTMEQLDGQESVTAYQTTTGKQLWATGIEEFFTSPMGGEGPRATPTISNGKVFALGAAGQLWCLDASTGSEHWSNNILQEVDADPPDWGKSNAPLVIDELGLVVVTAGQDRGPHLRAYRIDDGSLAWATEISGGSYSSPRLDEIDGVRQILSVHRKSAGGYDPATGEEPWNFDWPETMPKVGQPTITPAGQVLLTSGYEMGTFQLSVSCGEDGSWSATPDWETRALKTKFSSAVSLGNFAYGLNEARLVCIDLNDGAQVWKGDRYGFGQNLLIGSHILVLAERGYLALIDASPDDFNEVARLDVLKGKTWNPPAFAPPFLLVRNATEAACYLMPSSSVKAE